MKRIIPKALKKILLINWFYYEKQLIELGDINFLTGKTGSGKTTFIDALLIVLYGEANAKNFNRAAKNEMKRAIRSRSLESYLYTDLPEDNPASRKGKTFSSYIVCEYEDRIAGKNFVTGVVFDCYGSGDPDKRYFIYNGKIPKNCFIEDDIPMNSKSLRSFFDRNKQLKAETFTVERDYRTKMLARWNVHTEQALRLLKKGVSFEPIANIENFITQNVCDLPEKPDIRAMQQNIRDYKRQEQIAQRDREKIDKLKEISKLYRTWESAKEEKRKQEFLLVWSGIEIVKNDVERLKKEYEKYKAGLSEAEALREDKKKEIAAKDEELTKQRLALEQSDINKELAGLRENEKRLNKEKGELNKKLDKVTYDIRSEAMRLNLLCEKVLSFETDEKLTAIQDAAQICRTSYYRYLKCTAEVFTEGQNDFCEAAESISDFNKLISDLSYEIGTILNELEEKLAEKLEVLDKLKSNIKDYPKDLISLKGRLELKVQDAIKSPIHIDILADVLEIVQSEERWRGAVEGYLNTQKFLLLIDSEHYGSALKVYDNIKRDFPKSSYGLVDIEKLREKENIISKKGSLAEKIETESALARSYIDYLLGQVICCESVDELREYKRAITSEGMLYQGYVARPIKRALMEDTFIGQNAVKLRIAMVEKEIDNLKASVNKWQPVFDVLDANKDKQPLFSGYFVSTVVKQCAAEYVRGCEIEGELESIRNRRNELDISWIAKQQKLIKDLEGALATLREELERRNVEIGDLNGRVDRIRTGRLPEKERELKDLQNSAAIKSFSEEFKANVGIPLYNRELARLKRPTSVQKTYQSASQATSDKCSNAKILLVKERGDYARCFAPCSFNVDDEGNSEYDNELKELEGSSLPLYQEKIKKARQTALEMFQNDFLSKLKSNIDQVRDRVKDLNNALRRFKFGPDSYQFKVGANPDYADFYEMIMDPELMQDEGGLFAAGFQKRFGTLVEELFSRIADADDQEVSAKRQSELQKNIEQYTDFRTYMKFDLEMTDGNGNKQMLSQTLSTKSGGEMQTPFYIAVLASFAQVYRINDLTKTGETVRLVVFDEAFNKMDSEHVTESVHLLREMGLQAIISTPEDKIADIMNLADKTLLALPDRQNSVMRIIPWEKEFADDRAESDTRASA